MTGHSRRFFLQSALTATAGLAAGCSGSGAPESTSQRPSDIRITDLSFDFEEFNYRTPYKFGGVAVDRATLLNVRCGVETRKGVRANGFGSMPLSNVWAFPSREMPYQTTLDAMKSLAARIAKITSGYSEYGHPIDLNRDLELEYLKAAVEVSKELNLVTPIPKLCTQVTASAFDAAIHDAFGKAHQLSCYHTYGKEFMGTLKQYLNPDFKDEILSQYILEEPKPQIAMFHSVGGADPIVESDIAKRLNDGLPETLAEWINYNGLTHIKIKLQGEDLNWDIQRVVSIDRVASETKPDQDWKYCVDFNERCANVDYVLTFLRKVKELTPMGFERILYVEQPTARDLKANPQNVMHEAAKLRPVVIDESLTDLESLLLARELGYTGVALKACKGQSHAMLMAAAGQKYKMFLCVQDLTCPGASLIHSAGLAAHVPGVAGIEANSRQYVPVANEPWKERFPGIFVIKDGNMDTASLNKLGLSAVNA